MHKILINKQFQQVAMRYEAILACEGIAINGTGHQIVRAKKVRLSNSIQHDNDWLAPFKTTDS